MQLLLPEITAVTHPFILVLDDYHLISTPNIHKAMEMLLAYMPPQMHLVIISRADPPFSLPKLRVRRQLTEIRARDLLSLLDEAEMGERWGRVIKLRARQALRCEKMGDVATAIASLARAITLAEPEKYVRSFVDGGEAMERLLQMGMANGRLSSYAQNLLNAFKVTHDPQMSEVFETSDISRISENLTPATLIDPLGERELEVLSLITEGLTNKEIALRLHLSLGTVKVHAHNIYGKLDVNGRTQAVAKGRALNLLS